MIGPLALIAIVLLLVGVAVVFCRGEENDSKAGDHTGGAMGG